LQQKVPTSILNRALRTAVDQRQPVSESGHRLKFYYATQVRLAPPTFLLFVNRDELFSDQYKKYLGGEMRKAFGYEGCPILLVPKPRPKTIEPMRKFLKPDQRGGKRLGRPQRATRPQRSQGSSPSARPQSRSGRPQERAARPQSGSARAEGRSSGPSARPPGRAPMSPGHPQGRPFAPQGGRPGASPATRPQSFKKKHQRSHARGSNRAKGRRL
jgi:hypothetical protein